MEIAFTGDGLPGEGVVVALVGHDGHLSEAAAELDAATGGIVRRALDAAGKMRKHGHVIDLLLPAGLKLDRLLLLVAGKEQGVTRLELEELGGSLAKALRGLHVEAADLASPTGLNLDMPADEAAARIAHGARLRAYRFTRYHEADEESSSVGLERLTLHVSGGLDQARALLERLEAQAQAVARARDLVSEPGNVLYPETFADSCKELERFGVEVEILDEDRLRELGMRALLGVAQGSVRAPYVVVMRWRGAGDAPPVALVGKGVCFDSGGLSLKPAQGMEGMKWDMGGAGAVVGAMQAIAARKANANVVGVIGLVENMPSGTAQRPGDVIRAMSGKTIEVVNTDAEGRLVLADVLWYTQDRFKPRAMVDLATLTGAVIVALGHEQAGLFSNDESLANLLAASGQKVGERLWRMPIGQDYEKHIKSDIADIKNVGRAREAGATAGAVFVQQFTGGVPWAHLDIAGVAWTSRDLPLAAKGATGFGVRLLDQLVEDMLES